MHPHDASPLLTLIAMAMAALSGVVDDLALRTEPPTPRSLLDAALLGIATAAVTGTLT